MFNVLRSHQTAHHRVGVGLNLPWQVGLLVGDYLGPHHRLLLLLLLLAESYSWNAEYYYQASAWTFFHLKGRQQSSEGTG